MLRLPLIVGAVVCGLVPLYSIVVLGLFSVPPEMVKAVPAPESNSVRFERPKIPPELTARLEPIQNDPQAVIACGIDWAWRQCRSLLEGGAPGVHFYTLNRTHSAREILQRLRQDL